VGHGGRRAHGEEQERRDPKPSTPKRNRKVAHTQQLSSCVT
jgi:hypothetical protein